MITCNVCHWWRPQVWDGWKWSDATAPCGLKENQAHEGMYSCPHGSITEVKNDTVAGNVAERQSVRDGHIHIAANIHDDSNINANVNSNPPLYPHQQAAVYRYEREKEIALFWTMGTGKSRTILAVAEKKYLAGEINALLIVAPNQVHCQWAKQEVPKWLTCNYEVQCFGGSGGAKKTYPFESPEALQIVCVNIDTFSTPKKWTDIVEWHNSKKTMIVLDEATSIKNVNSKRTQRMLYAFNQVAMRGKSIIKSEAMSVCRAVLTGTPVTNGPMDIWSIMEFLRPNYFNKNWYAFQNHYSMFTTLVINDRVIKVPLTEEWWHSVKRINSYEEACRVCGCSTDTFNTIHAQEHYEGPYKHAGELKQLLEPVASFKQLTDCVCMPEQLFITRELIMSSDMQKCYNSMVDDYIAEYKSHSVTALNKMTIMIRLQQISSGFIYDKTKIEDTEEYDVTPDDPIQWIGRSNPKLEALYNDVAECEKPVIILTRFSAEAARIFNDLSEIYRCCLMTGWKRVGTIEQFQNGEFDIMVANSSVVARGFNLQNSHTVLFYSNTFSLETRLQAEGRIFRLGQEDTCVYTDYTYTDSVDEKIVSALRMKRNLLDFITGVENVEELIK